MSYSFDSWTTAAEDPIGAAMRADVGSKHRVADAAFDYRSAIASGDKTAIKNAQQAFRAAWESDVRRHGGQPQDFIPDYLNAKLEPTAYPPLPPPPWGWFGQTETPQSSALKIASTLAGLYILWMFLA
tara:strand:- start:45 stop:428 length:384 start_codon:yes stop_codon:yes gene_type:complete